LRCWTRRISALVLLHELCDDPIETFLAKDGVAEPSSATATKQFHQV
jgi:hypothetical protein